MIPRSQLRFLTAVVVLLVTTIALLAGTAVLRRHEGNRLMRGDPEEILAQPDLRRFALSRGKRLFAAHCAACHRAGDGDPARGVPDLTDGDYLYGTGSVAEIEQIILYGIRSRHPRGWNQASMPAYGHARPYWAEPIPPLARAEIADIVSFILAKHGGVADRSAAARGGELYRGKAGCYDCHGPDGAGDPSIGAPNLLDDVWLYGDGSAAAITRTLVSGRAGFSPAYARILSPVEARAVAVYVASLSRRSEGSAQ